MQVETYEVPEVDCDGEVENDQEAIALIESLGRAGQKKLLNKTSGKTEWIPYPKMMAEEKFVYKLILPRVEPIDQYSDGPIPLRILQVAAHAKSLYSGIQVWCPENADMPDPLLVGWNGQYDWSPNELFILARWGEVLEPFAKLISKAAALFRGKVAAAVEEAMSKAALRLEQVNRASDEFIVAGKLKCPTYDD